MKKYIVTYLLLLFTILSVQAEDIEIRYVKTDGSYSNDGKSWATAKNNVQDAINDLYDVIKNTDKEGHVYVAAGTYYPTESTESDKDGTFYTAFKIYEGVSVYGGFAGTEDSPKERVYEDIDDDYYYGKRFTNVTILDGNHTLMGDKKNLVWDEKKQQYTTTFLSNSYHVVWFATKGFDANGRANGLSKSARIDGCTIQGGYASNRVTTTRHHNSYGGGVYMVAGSYVDNCVVTQNVATCGGGAIYMDGGGEVNHSYVRRNQCLGIGADDGFGGGICVDGAGVVRHSMIAENVARIGGGLALLSEEVTSGNRYAPAALGCVVGNNTTMTEAGGVYMRFGGVLNHLTIVNNQCNGPNLVYEGRRYGRSAGIYIDRYGEVFNTVCWGGKIEANSNIQYAAYVRSDQIEKPHVHYSAFTQYEITDWSSTTRFNVIGLAERNSDTAVDAYYPDFIAPTTTTGVGIADNVKPQWQPYAYSVLKGSGVMLLDYDYALNQGDKLVHARLEKDMYGTNFVAKTTLGAYVPRSEKFLPATIDGCPTLFVDPSRKYSQSLDVNPDEGIGYSWDCPLGNLNDALYYFTKYPASATNPGRILVKEGELKTTGNYMAGRLRANSLMMTDNVEVYGGYPATLTGTATTGRDPIAHPTHISGNIANDDYDNNVHHLVRFQDVSNAVLDGFRLYYGNAYSTNLHHEGSKHGGGVIVFTYEKTQMSGNALRNCIIANCTAIEGGAIFITGLGSGGEDDNVKFSMENCIIHNNESKIVSGFIPSAICARGSGTNVNINHCTVRGNIGYAVATRNNAKVTLNNSVIHANANVKVDNISTLTSTDVLTVYTESDGKINGSNNLVDNGESTPDGTNNQAILTYASSSANYPSFVNPTRNVGVSEVVDNTVYGGYPNFMPENMSPLVNAAQVVSLSGTDITTNITRNYGGLPDVGAVENTNLPANGTVYYVRKSDGNDSDTGLSWANAFATMDKALTVAQNSNGVCKQIWVAAGTYYENLTMVDGVNVYGGFIASGNPGMKEGERDISNMNPNYQTIIDGQASGRVLDQDDNFANETMWEGFTFQNGKMTFTRTSTTELSTITTGSVTEYSYDPKSDGWDMSQTYDYDVETTTDPIGDGWTGTPYYANGKTQEVEVTKDDEYTRVEEIVSTSADYNRVETTDIDRTTFRNAVPVTSRAAANSEATAYKNGNNYYWGIGQTSEGVSASDYDFVVTAPGGGASSVTQTEFQENVPESDRREANDQTTAYNGYWGVNPRRSNKNNYDYSVGTSYYKYQNYYKITNTNTYYNYTSYNKTTYYKVAYYKSQPVYERRKYSRTVTKTIKSATRNQSFTDYQRGGGVRLFYNGTLKNCLITENTYSSTVYNGSNWLGGGGLFMRRGSKVMNCIIKGNEVNVYGDGCAAGVYAEDGLFINSLIVENKVTSTSYSGQSRFYILGAGMFLGTASNMYNCTVAYNFADNGGRSAATGGIWDNAKTSQFYNCILWGNAANGNTVENYFQVGMSGFSTDKNGGKSNANFHDCFHAVPIASYACDDATDKSKVHLTDLTGTSSTSSSYNAFINACKATNLLNSDYSINSSSALAQYCINMGSDGGADILENTYGITQDIAGAERVQDCTIDKGAYEYNGAKDITADITTTNGVAYYYVTQNGRGTATAASPANAACWEKLQKVLDAAGRYKYDNPEKQVVVKLAAFPSGGYMPRRSAVADGSVEASNPRTYSIQVPRGVEVWGGYTDAYTNTSHGFLETRRNVMTYKTTLNGCYQASGQDVNVYHVVTFTDLVFDTDGKVIADQRLSDKAGNMGHYNKAVLDGLHITGGMANGINDDDRRGGAAIVTDYAHVRNCIVHDNEAAEEGGAFYMKPRSLVSGTLLKNNTSSNRGGAIFVEEPAVASSENYARIFTSTIVKNSAKEGGGVNFETNLRANSIVLWDNTANAQANISGQLDPYSTQAGVSQTMNDYPLIFSAVENLQVAGINNMQVDAEEQKGVRFSDDEYYGIEPTSVLVRTGMRYQEYETCLQGLPTLKREDFAGISRVGFNNDYIDIGARATTESFFAEISETNLLTRLYVVSPEIPLDLDLQNTLMNAQGEKIYNQVGSSFANPMIRLDDALEYIRKARKTDIPDVANTKFEIFVSRGLFYPLRTIRGEYSYSRANTYLVPEGVTIIGGMATDVIYGQGTTNETVGGKTIRGATTADIRKSRIHFDLNNNGIIEPWEMKEQTILSGNNVNSENSENVYHVIAAIPAEQWVGKLPGTSGIANNSQTALESLTADGTKHVETGQYIWLDGLYISDGYAYGYEPNFVGSKHTYFKGGAICVNGNWVSGSAADSNGDRDMFLNTDKNHPLGYRNIPLMVTNCQFSNNVGGMGGAIFSNGDLNIYGCSFTQNYSKGGYDVMGKNQNDEDITNNYTGNGGAINASGRVFIANTLFANNEAQKGTYQSTLSAQTTGGWGGAILAGDYSRLHILNCNFVRNKATNYPAIYNYVANKGWAEGDDSDYYFTDSLYTSQEVRVNNPHRVVNSIFWGNESEPGGIYKSMYLGPEGEEVEHMWFCGYEDNCGLTPKTVLPTDEFDYRKVDFNFHTDADGVKRAAYIPTLFKIYYDTKMGGVAQQDGTAIQPWQVTNNIILNQDNAAMDGPNFINPSQKAGIEGYMVSADWMVSRINNLVDNGWTYLKQDDAGKFVTPIDGSGIYKDVADEFFDQNYKVYSLMPYGTEEYMYYPDLLADGVHHRQMYRISNDPNPTHTATYIDIGIYEYQHTALNPTTVDGMRDILWVTSAERQDLDSPADGSDWLHATSDLQRAIETLLSGRNGHAKEIRMIEGTYMPIYTIGDNLGFKISTSNANNSALATSELKGIQSFTIRGGYSSETADLYDYYEYPVSIMSPERTGVSAEKIKHLLFIEDARQYESVGIEKISHQTTDEVVPIVLEGLNFKDAFVHEQSQGGAAVYYSNQLKDDKKTNGDYINGDDGTTCLSAPTSGAKRLTIANCSFVKSGSNTNVAIPAVCIGKGGGDALIYNSLFHSNIGSPLLATDTKVINSTFALNGGLVGLNNEMSGCASELHNSVLWKNNQNKVPSVAEISNLASGVVYQHNAFSGIESNGTNDKLNDDNDDIFTGPNFFDPENADIALRDFRIKPSAVLLSEANDKTFAMKVLGEEDNLEPALYQTAVANTTDLAYFRPRSYGKGLDRGAFECHEQLNRIIYVDPNKMTSTGTGESWENAYEYGRLQNAIDATSVYLITEAADKEEAYVFVKGKREGSTSESITLRNGVQVYGSIDPGYSKQVVETINGGNISYAENNITAYLKQLHTDRPGLAGTHTYRTQVNGVSTTATSYSKQTLLDGFLVSNPNHTDVATVVLNDNTLSEQNHLAMRNCIVAGNRVTGDDEPVVNVGNGLLYNVLVQENNSGDNAPVVKVGAKGRIVNCTVVAHEAGKNTVEAVESKDPLVFNCVTYNVTDNKIGRTETNHAFSKANNTITVSPFAPYLQPGTTAYHADKPEYLTENHYLWYQLHEKAKDLESADEEVNSKLPEKLRGYINLSSDRDVLGNPREVSSMVDRGCFETWQVKGKGRMEMSDAYIPQEGSVVYIQPGASLKLDKAMTQVFRPAYLLLRQGASLYGQGANVELEYVAVERKVAEKGYSLFSLPYDYALGNAVRVNDDDDDDDDDSGALTETTVDDAKMHTYDGAKRATYSYHFVEDDSPCWIELATGEICPANRGVLLTVDTEGLYRYTAYANAKNNYIYTEGGSKTFKEVVLTQYNHTPADNAVFTSLENMGWNLVGMPYLVSNYPTSTPTGNGTYQMNIPHVIYTLDAQGNYSPKQSWDAGADLSIGQAFFTQTATLDDAERLKFQLPVFPTTKVSDTRALLCVAGAAGSDAVQLNPDDDAEELADYQLNYDGVKMMAMNKDLPQVYALNASGSRLALVGSAPVEQEINVGLYAAKADEQYTFSLPDRESFAVYGSVWLKDNHAGIVTDLMTEDYTCMAKMVGRDENRLTIQIGGLAPVISPDGSQIDGNHVVYIRDGVLYISRLIKGQTIQIYTVDGRLIHQTIAEEDSYRTAVSPGIYLVKIDDDRYKAM